ncbi:MAG: thioredoxin domain-containing protein, partial [Halobacteriota archaeon]
MKNDSTQRKHGRSDIDSNRLANERSPYLLQHAHNPVDWYPWGHEAFETAQRESKPIFLSIGYSACHWCHVMAHESFEDSEIAALMNDAFVNVKVDREERPDVDAVYMSACQALTGFGGWPLTIVATSQGKPFFAATYLPRTTQMGRTGLKELIYQIKQLWEAKRDEV